MEIVVILIIGAVAGWLGSTIYKGRGLGLLGNIVIGIIGSFVGYWALGNSVSILAVGGLESFLQGLSGQ